MLSQNSRINITFSFNLLVNVRVIYVRFYGLNPEPLGLYSSVSLLA